MRRAYPPCRPFPVLALVLAFVVGSFALLLLPVIGPASPARAAAEPLSIEVDSVLSLAGQPITVTASGQFPDSLMGAELSIRLIGPVDASDIGQKEVEAPEAAAVSHVLGKAPAQTATTLASTTTTTIAAASVLLRQGTVADLESGRLEATIELLAGILAEPGAYLLEVRLSADGEVLAGGDAWIGKVADRDMPFDVAFVLPVSLGIHRDAAGAFFDQVLEQMVASAGTDGGLSELFKTLERLAKWDFTLAIEPILLTQLRDMADGYLGVDSSGVQVQVSGDDPKAMEAGATLATIEEVAGQERVQVVASPYAGADLSMIAAEGWRDGLQQIQMGKQELQQTLGLTGTLIGAYSPDLDLTSEALTYYAGASVDHVVVSDELIDSMAEPVGRGTVTARARDLDNDRVTLVFASTVMTDVMSAPWDATLFAPSLAAELAAIPRDAIVLVPDCGFSLAPAPYVEKVGAILKDADWIRTQTLTELIRAHSPGTRPVLLQTASPDAGGYIEESLLGELRAAHAAVTDLAASSDSTRAPVDAAYRLLAVAESRWWWRDDISPREASIGLDYVAQALSVARGELERVRFSGAGSTFITGNEGVLELNLQNASDYPLNVELRLTGEGVTFPAGENTSVELQPGETSLQVQVVRSGGGDHDLTAQLFAGNGVLDELSVSLRFFSLTSMLPWLILAVVVIAAGTYFLVRSVLRKRAAAKKAAKTAKAAKAAKTARPA